MSSVIDLGNWQTYRKIATVEAIQMPFPFRVKTLEGVVQGKAGDWLCRGVKGECWPVDDEVFQQSYVLAGAPKKDACGCAGSCGCKDAGLADLTVDELLDYLFGAAGFTTATYDTKTKTLNVDSDTSVTLDQIFNALVDSEDS